MPAYPFALENINFLLFSWNQTSYWPISIKDQNYSYVCHMTSPKSITVTFSHDIRVGNVCILFEWHSANQIQGSQLICDTKIKNHMYNVFGDEYTTSLL